MEPKHFKLNSLNLTKNKFKFFTIFFHTCIGHNNILRGERDRERERKKERKRERKKERKTY